MGAQQIGLAAIWNNANFQQGQAAYMQGLLAATNATTKTSTSIGQTTSTMNPFSTVIASVAGALGITTQQLGAMTAGLGIAAIAVKALNTVFNAVKGAVSGFIDFMVKGSDSALMVASRVQQLNYIAQTLGQRMGYSGEQINGFVSEISDAGISLGVANQLVAQFARYNIDMAKSVDLARVAQDAATLANEGSSDALEGLLHGITTGNVRVLRTHGIMIASVEDAYKAYADQIGVNVDALNNEQRVMALTNAVIEEGGRISGAYAASMMTAGKQLGTLNSRILPDFKAAMGAPLQQAFFNVVLSINKVIGGVTKLITEGGALYPVMIKIGAIASLITEPLASLATWFEKSVDAANASATAIGEGADATSDSLGGMGEAAEDAGESFMTKLVDKISETVNKMFDWGIKIVTELARGLIQGASTAIIQAINFISRLLTSWFMPGSPPRVAPDIDQWGADTMHEYLAGFTETDFNVLRAIQAPLKSVLTTMGGLGAIAEEEIGTIWADLSGRIIQSMSKTGTVTADILADITAISGEFGDEIIDLIQKQSALADATKKVEDSERALEVARKRQTAAGQKANKAVLEYNQMLRSGASAEALANKMAEVNAAQEEQQIANADMVTAEERLDASEETLAVMREQAALTEEMLQTMLELTNAQIESAKAAEAAAEAGGAGGGELETPPTPTTGGGGFDPEGIVDNMRDAIDAMKEELRSNLGKAWAPVANLWNAKWSEIKLRWEVFLFRLAGAVANLRKMLQPYWDAIVAFWDENLQPIVDKIKSFFPADFGSKFLANLGKVAAIVGTVIAVVLVAIKIFMIIKTVIMAVGAVIGFLTNPIFLIIGAIALLVTAWQTNFLGIRDIAAKVWAWIKTAFANVVAFLTNLWTNLVTGVRNAFSFVANIVTNVMNRIRNIINTVLTAIRGWWERHGESVKTVVSTLWNAITTVFKTAIGIIVGIVMTIVNTIMVIWNAFKAIFGTAVAGTWEAIKTIFTNAFMAILGIVMIAWETIKTVFMNTFNAIKEIISQVWNSIKAIFEIAFEAIGVLFDFWAAIFQGKWSEAWEKVKEYIGLVWITIKGILETVWNSIVIIATTTWENIKTIIGGIVDGILVWLTTTWENIKVGVQTSFDNIKSIMENIWTAITERVTETWDNIKTFISDAIEAIRTAVNERIQAMRDNIVEHFNSIVNWILGLVGRFRNAGRAIIDGLKEGIISNVRGLVNTVENMIQDVLDAIDDLLHFGSPSKVTEYMFKMAMVGMEKGVERNAMLPQRAMTRAVTPMIGTAAKVPIMAGAMSRTLNVNMGGQVIQNGMSSAAFELTVRRIIRAELGAT